MVHVVLLEHVMPDQLSYCAAQQDIRREMFLPEDAGQTHTRSDRVPSRLHPLRRILARQYSCQRPRQHAVRRGKRAVRACVRQKEVPCRIVVERTLPPKDDFRDYFDTICKSFTTQDAGFARVHIALEKSDAFTLFLLKVRSCDMSRMASVSVASVKPAVAPSGSNQIGHASGSAPGWSRSKKAAGSSSVSLAHPPRLPKIVPPPPGWNWDLRRPGDDNSAQACGSFLRPRHSRLCDRQIYADCSMV